jgi:small subunit ribosomal protein S15
LDRRFEICILNYNKGKNKLLHKLIKLFKERKFRRGNTGTCFLAICCYNKHMLTKRVKSKISTEHGKHEKDTGSASVQIASLSYQIDELAKHLKKNPKDNHSRRGLLKMVSKRRKFMTYMKEKEPSLYDKLVKKLDLKR